MRHWTYVLAAVTCVLVLAGGWALSPDPTKPLEARAVDAVPADGSGIFDGMTFTGRVTVNGEPLDVVEKWVFSHGTFMSAECALRCNYPRAPYFIREVGDAVEFISESHCLDKDAKIVWRGTIDNETVRGTMTWTFSRWYWNMEREFEFAGTLSARAASIAGN